MLRIKEFNDKRRWETFLNRQELYFYPFFQSWNFGEVQKALGSRVWRVGIFDENKIVGVCQIVEIVSKKGKFLHLRHGPVLKKYNGRVFDFLISYVKKQAQELKSDFIRISPLIKKDEVDQLFKKQGFVNSPLHNMDAQNCWVLNIDKTEDQLLSEMRKTHRYLIKKALKMEIKIIRTENIDDINKFVPLYKDLSTRKHFVPHAGVKEEFDIFSKDHRALLFLAIYQKKILAGAIVVFTPKMAIYRHGASLSKFKDVPASYILQWEAIKVAKDRKIPLYNFWGVAPDEKPNHPWAGLTLFKKGFGGYSENFLHAQDLPLTPKYYLTWIFETLRRITKGY